MPAQSRLLDQAHNGNRSLPNDSGADLVFDPVIVDRCFAGIEVSCQLLPAFEAVVDDTSHSQAIRRRIALRDQPSMQDLGDRLGPPFPNLSARIGGQLGHAGAGENPFLTIQRQAICEPSHQHLRLSERVALLAQRMYSTSSSASGDPAMQCS